MPMLRSQETANQYREYIDAGNLAGDCVLCAQVALHDFDHWKIIDNKFPYDQVAQTHHMLIPKRHTVEIELTDEEQKELAIIKHGEIVQAYEFMLEAMHHRKSIPTHFHLHLIVIKD